MALHCDHPFSTQTFSFIVRIWWEAGLARPDGRPLWRGQVREAAGDRSCAFQSLDELVAFIQGRIDALEGDTPLPGGEQSG